MNLAIVLGSIVSTEKHSAYDAKKLLLVQRLDIDQKPTGIATVAVDYVGAGQGDTVLLGAAPGLATVVFGVPRAPMRELIMGIVDSVADFSSSGSR